MNPNQLMKAIRMYSNTTINQMALIIKSTDRTVYNIENNKDNVAKYYETYAKQAGIPMWIISYILSEDDIDDLSPELRDKVLNILSIYEKIDEEHTPRKKSNPAIKLMQQIRRDMRTLEKMLGA